MRKMLIQKAAGSLLLAAGMIAAPLASAGTLTYQGVKFTFTESANILTLQIDAGSIDPTSDWATATTIGALEVKNIAGTFTDVTLTGDTGFTDTSAATAWSSSLKELNANGCMGGTSGGSCFWADLGKGQSRIPLGDGMLFHFAYNGGTYDFSDPTLKVAFYNGDGTDKVGSLLSMPIPAVPEPESYGMFLMGLGILAFLARPKKA